MVRRIKFSRWGLAEDPIGMFVSYSVNGRTKLREVVGTYRSETPSVVMLQLRSFDRTITEDVAAAFVEVIEPDYCADCGSRYGEFADDGNDPLCTGCRDKRKEAEVERLIALEEDRKEGL